MAMTQNGSLARDDNDYPVMGGTSSSDDATIINSAFDPITRRLLTDASGGGTGTVTSVSVVTANGFAGSVADPTTTPAITLSTTVTGIVKGNGTAISAAVAGTDYVAPGAITSSGLTMATARLLGRTTGSTGAVEEISVGTGLTLSAGTLVASTSGISPLTTKGDIWGYSTVNARVPVGSDGQVLTADSAQALGVKWAAGPAASLTVGTTTISSGTNTRILYDNSGVLGEYTLTGSGTVVAMQTSPQLVTPNIGVATGTSLDVSGVLESGANGGTGGQLKMFGSTSGDATLRVAAVAGTATVFQLPATNGSNTNLLQTDGSGVTSWVAIPTAPVATTITVANEASDTTCFPLFVTAATGDLGAKSNTGLTFNSSTASLGATLMTATTSLTTATVRASSNDSGSLGASGTAFSDLFLASGAVIDFAAGNSVITHSSAVLTVSTGDLRVTTAGTNSASVVTVGGTQTLTNKTLSAPGITGTALLAEGASIGLDPAGSADGAYSGITMTATAGYTQAFGDLVYLSSADSRWELADADAAATAGPVALAMVVVAGTDGNSCTLLLQGRIRADAKFPTMTVGATQYVGETAGAIQGTIPTGADNIIRTVGYALTADELYFNPSTDWQVTVA